MSRRHDHARGPFLSSKSIRWSIAIGALSLVGLVGWNLTTAHSQIECANAGGGADTSRGATRGDSSSANSSGAIAEVAAMRESTTIAKKNVAAQQLAHMPTVFVRNDGQWDSSVRFGAHGHGANLSFNDRGMVLGLRGKDEDGNPARETIALDFVRDGVKCTPKGERELAAKHNYFLGNDPKQWHSNVPLYEGVRYDSIAPGVALLVTDRAGKLEYDLHVEPGADLGQVSIETEGVDSLEKREDGALVMQTPLGAFEQRAPKAWYELSNGEKKVVECSFKVTGPTSYGFEVPSIERDAKLTVDPIFDWSTYFGGSDSDRVNGIDYNGGYVTIAGYAASTDIPLPPNTQTVYQRTNAGGWDAFVAKLDPSQSGSSQLVWSTYVGGSGTDEAKGIAVDASGNSSICGRTDSTDFPTTSGAYQSSRAGSEDAFVSYLSSDGTSLLYSTYFGGSSGAQHANALAVDSTPYITIVGATTSASLLMSTSPAAYDSSFNGTANLYSDAFVAKFDPNASGSSSLKYSSYVGGGTGTTTKEAFTVALESTYIYIGGYVAVYSTVATTTGAYQTTAPGNGDGFIVKLDPSASTQNVYTTYFGGASGVDKIFSIDVHSGVIYGTGYTESTNFSTGGSEASAWHSSKNGTMDAFLFKLNPSASPQLKYSTYLGGGGSVGEWGMAVARVQDRSALVVGWTESSSFPTSSDAVSTSLGGGGDGFVTRLNWANNRSPSLQIDYSTYLGGSDGEQALCLVMNGSNTAYVGGYTFSTDFPTAGSPLQSSLGSSGYEDGFVCRFNLPLQQ